MQESNFRRDMVPLLMRTDPEAAITAAADFIARCDRRNDTGQVNNALAYLATINHDLGEAELAATVVGSAGETRLTPSSARTYEATKSALRVRFGDAYEDLTEEGSQRPTQEIVRAILVALDPHS